jgi:multiple sugar transport system ATP-binding protein
LTDGSLVGLPGAPVNVDWRELGVRPESLTVVSEGNETSATATVVERLGERTLVYARLADGTQVTAQDRALSSVKPGDLVRLKFDTAALHLFAADGSTWHAR